MTKNYDRVLFGLHAGGDAFEHIHPYAHFGPYYDQYGLASQLHITEDELERRTEARELLGARTDEGELVYPVWQFDQRLRVRKDVRRVLKHCPKITDGWAAVQLFNTNTELLHGMSILEWRRRHHSMRRVFAALDYGILHINYGVGTKPAMLAL